MNRLLPVGMQDFVAIRERGFCYVDKTALIHKLVVGSGDAVFLSRPRRFGKTLLCSTLEAVFSGRRDLFGEIAGQPALAIDSLEWAWKKHPVIHLSLGSGRLWRGVDDLDGAFKRQLQAQAIKLDLELPNDSVEAMFLILLRRACKKFGEKAVVIIDDYDKPLLETIDDPIVQKQVRRDFGGLYAILKTYYTYLRFVFLTGRTRFSYVSLFSGLNNLDDISLDSDFACICGITQDELESTFEPEIAEILAGTEQSAEEYMERLRKYYHGYRFSKLPATVYSPSGLILDFDNGGKLSDDWYSSTSPDSLIRLLTKHNLPILALNPTRIAERSFRRLDFHKLERAAVLYQSGYLTVSDYDEERDEYVLDFPNLGVSSTFARSFASESIQVPEEDADALITNLPLTFAAGDIDGAIDAIRAFLASIPHSIVFPSENFYETAIFIMFKMLGIKCHVEMQLLIGRIDILVVVPQYVYCFEFKIIRPTGAPVSTMKLQKAATSAVAQITKNEYLLPWVRSRKKLYRVGVVIDGSTRNVGEWKCEMMDSAELTPVTK
ncbi:MAG: ATP-binding protein [Polyangiaceae bacterium]|nr:ATP-binding protein [Polyangiaceae bacterium]